MSIDPSIACINTLVLFGGLMFFLAAGLDWLDRGFALPQKNKEGLWVFRVSWLASTALIAQYGLTQNSLPINTVGEIFFTLGWGLAGSAIFLDLVFNHRLPTWAMGALTAFALIIASFCKIESAVVGSTTKPIILIHVGAAILAYCILAAQAINALAYLLQNRALAQRKFGGIYTFLPSLVPMDRIGAQLMGAVVWMLGLSLIIGSVDWIQSSLSLVKLPKLTLALITWVSCFILVIQHRRQKISGAAFARATLYLTIPALVALWLSLPNRP